MILKFSFVLICSVLLLKCGTPSNKPNQVIGQEEIESDSINASAPVISEVIVPEGAVYGNFNGDLRPFYSQISMVGGSQLMTEISFQDNAFPKIRVPKTKGGILSPVSLEGFDRELLLFTAKLKDPNFNKYYVFVQRDGFWKPVVNGFAIHKSNLSDTLTPFKIDPNNSKNILRHYSVFNLDNSNEKGYSWLLQEESVPMENW